MGLEGLVKRMDPHTVGGGQQGELFVDDRLDGGNPVAPLADRVDLPLQSQVGVAELGQLRLHRLDPVAQTEFQAARGEGEKGLVAGACVAVGLEIIRVGFKENPEHVAGRVRRRCSIPVRACRNGPRVGRIRRAAGRSSA